ncbi:2-acylglycerol O-acyltransferase protein [Dioscorea alata]|uniref:2-acylglycerol O-acyltransferase protein n=5 Tax=Dioscorea alata TaxID=55571 RepID=A0ACB7TQR3_DIOAL|nr:2-acylglycerol O-acyltransferase protein [Dioscorea alata]KAH7650921.1 2-acylglycerol O-acyltransferase protein [Dioscorea alata]KAH7650922.1 2-acylglycerol O-acyltransferase protein [Dioscorea alata]KAH7650923.1 2-acylglycerol O-acyltransferase protein [Dioscorea alata]KAH7650924.1 2-acylglycerol O-acyltransferase protein [Dioscorea alata]
MSMIPMRTHLQLSKHPTRSLIPHRRSLLQMEDCNNRRCHYVRAHITASKKVIEGVSDELNSVASQNMDFAPTRRRVRSAFLPVQQQLDHVLFKMPAPEIQMEEKYEMSSKGVEIFWKSWRPPPGVTMKAALFFCHGYGDTCTFFFEGIAKKVAKAGYAVYAMDYPSFGLSEGLHGYIHSFDEMVDHVIEQYARIRGMEELRGLHHFLLGQSMGGAVALKVHLKQPTEWDGVVLVAPMCKIAEDVTPPAPILKALAIISNFLPEAKLFPQKDLAELAFRIPLKRKMTAFNVIAYSDQMRLRTAVELIKATRDIESQLEKVSSPLLILHGAADKVTDPQVSKYLYNKACSEDKTLKLYEESYHSILEGEPDDRILEVINDIISWLDSHSTLM